MQIGTETLTATSANDAGTATWSVTVPGGATYITGTSVDVSVSASKPGFTSPSAVERSLTVDLTAPTAPSYTAPESLQVGVAITSMSPSGGGGIDEYSATGLPSGLSIAPGAGVISGTPDTADASTASATVTVSDPAGNTVEVSITFPAVGKGDQTLSGFEYSSSSIAFGSAAPTVTAPSGVETTLSYSAEPSTVCSVDSSSGALTLVGVGICTITATAEGSDNYNEASVTFAVTVQATGVLVLNLDAIATDNTINIEEKAAGFTISGNTGSEGGVSVTVTVGATELTATSADTDPAIWSVNVPPDASYITGTSVDLTVSASKIGFTAPSSIARTVTGDLTAPTAPSYTAPASLKVGVAITGMSPTGGVGIDTYAVTNLPSGLVIDAGDGTISGTPDTADINTTSATVTVSDTAGNTDTVSITFPAVAKGDQTLSGFQYSSSSIAFRSAAPTVTAPKGAQTTLGYSAAPDTVCSVDDTSGALTLVGVGVCTITATAEASDNYNDASATFAVTVQATGALVLNVDDIASDGTINIAEKASGFSISGNTGSEGGVSVTVTVGSTELTATSADAGTATWSVSVPADASYITGTSVDVSVSASKSGFASPSAVERSLTVDLTAPTAPSYTAPASLQVGVAITSKSPSGGADIDAYAVTDLPSGLDIDPGTGVISGTPDTADTNTTSATVTVIDTAGNTDTAPIAFPAVAKGDQTLSGFEYSASSVTFGFTAPIVTTPTGVQTTLSYLATPDTVCVVDSSTGALTLVGVGTCVVTVTAASNSNYNQVTATFTVTVQASGALVELSAAPATVDEAGSAPTVTVTGTLVGGVRSTDTAVSVSVGAPGDAATEGTDYATVHDVTLTIEAGQTSGTVDVTLTPIDDDIVEGDETLTVAGTTGVENLAVTATVFTIRDDERGVVVSPTSLTVSEGSSASYSVVLTSRPSGSVKVTISGPSGTDLQRSRSLIWFNRTNWNQAQTVTVTAHQDDDAEDDTVTLLHTISGADYGVNGVTADSVSVTIDDDDEAASALVLNVDAVAVDDIINIAEKASGFDITGDTGSQGGMSVTVTVGATELTTTSADADPATWSVSIPADASYITGTSIDVTVSASKSGFAGPGDVERALAIDLAAPTAPTYPVPSLLKVDMAIPAMGPSGGSGIAEYSATGVPSGLIIDSSTGVISGTPDAADASTAVATVTVSDEAGNTDTVSITFPAVDKGDQTLNGFNYSASSAMFGDSAPTVTAPTGAQTTLSYSAAPSTVCTVNSSTGALTIVSVGRCEITATAAGTDDYKEAKATFTVMAQSAGALVELSVAPATVDESGAATMVTVMGTLVGGARSTATAVSVSVGAPGDAATEGADYATVNDVTLTIEAGQTSATVDVTLTPIDDDIVEGDETLTVAGTTGVEDLAVTATGVTIRDDERGVVVSPTSLTVSEGGSASYSVVLTSRPSGSVKVTISDPSGTDLQRSRGLMWFTRTNWSVAQTVTVTAHEDDDAEDDTVTLLHTVSGADYGVNGVTADPVSVTIDDDEPVSSGVALSVNTTAVDEDASVTDVIVTGTLNGVARAAPTILTVSVGASDDAAIAGSDYVAVDDLTLTIPSGQSSGTATFTFTAINDFIDERVEAVSITATTEVAGYAVTGTTLSITDNDERGVQITPTAFTLPEGGNEAYTVVLTSQPTGGVTVTPSMSGSPDVTFTPSILTFTTSDWDQAQKVTVNAAQDADADNDTATLEHAVAGADYGANSVTAADVSVMVVDDELAVTLTVDSASVDEDGDGIRVTVTGTLDGLPRDEPAILTVSVGASDDAATEGGDYVAVDDLSLTIDAGQAFGTATFTLTPIHDDVDEADETLTVAGSTSASDLSVVATTVTITDNDERGVRIVPTTIAVPEGGNEAYTAVLASQPTGDVTVTPSVNGSSNVTVSTALTFTATNWDQAQTVTVSAAQDADSDNDTATLEHAVSGADYGANRVSAADVSVTVVDSDTAVTLTVDSASVDEDGDGTSVTVTGTLDGVARAEPTILTVSVGASDDAAIAGADYVAVDDRTLTIPSGQASGTATFTLTPLEDRIDEPDEAVSITGTSQVAGYAVTGTTLFINDNDERGVTVSPSVLTLTEGASATYTVVLDTEPTQTVTVTPSVSGSPDVTFTPPSLTFTSSDWDTAQAMTVSAIEDDDASHDSSIVIHTAQGAEYGSLADGELSVTISDNEVASQGVLPAQVTGVSATATATQVELTWVVGEDTVLGYRVEASYDGGANWAAIEDDTESTDTSYRHDVGLRFSETRRYRVSALGENGAGLPSDYVRASATATTGGLTATVAVSDDTTDPVPAVDLCWIPEGVAASELSDAAIAWTPDHSSRSDDLSDLPWQSVGSGSSAVDCEDGMGIRVTSINENQRYAFRMRANHAGAWWVSNEAEALWVDSSRPLRTVVTAGASGLSGDTPAPELICRNFNDPATREDEQGSFFISIGFTTAPPEYLRYEPVSGFDPSSDLTLVNATAQRVDRPYDTRLGYRMRITPSVWGEPVAVSLAGDVVTHEATSVGNQASGEFRRETADSVDCDTSAPEPARRSQVTAVGFEQDGDRNGAWTAGEPIRVTLQFDEPVRVTTTDGVPSVTLTIGEAAPAQSSNGEAAVEVTAPFSHVAHEDTLVFEHLVTADEGPIGDITLLADSLSLNGGAIDSFSGPAVDLAHPEAAATDEQIVRPDLTAGWSMIPGAHEGGESSFEIHLKFSEAVDLIEVIGEPNLLEHAFTVTGGSIEAIRPARDTRGEFLAGEWVLRVAPASEEPVMIAPVVDRACDQPGAICTIDDRLLIQAPSVTVQRTERGLSVADAEVGEGPGAVLVFEVTLARAADHPVTVDYETADDTATAGQDYAAASGTLRIEAGQTTGRVRVRVIDDSHDEGEETLTLILSNASNAQIHDGEALGIIVNSDPMPGAWLARFGRAASDHVAQAIARRLERGPREEHMTVGGLRLDRLFASVSGPDDGRAASGSTHLDPDPSGSGAMASPSGLWAATGAGYQNMQPAVGLGTGTSSSGPTGGSDAQGSPGGRAAPYGPASPGSDTLPSLRDVLMGSSFFYTHGESDDATSSPLTAWGETASTRFKGSDGSLSLDGEVTTAMVGLDKRYGRWLVGSTLSYSEGKGGYQGSGALGGSMHSTLTSLNPYAHFELNESTSLWGVIGYGSGRLRLTPEGAESALETDLSNRMAAFGGRGLLSVGSGDAGRFELALRSDALLTRTDSDAVHGLAGAQGATSRVRLMLEGSGSMPVWGGMLSPTLEAGLRYDGGDAETGAGVEVSGGLGYAANRLKVEVNARVLVAHEDTEYEEWGFSGSIAYTPGEDGRGLSMKLGSAWGSTQSGVQLLWSRQDASGLARNAPFAAARRFQAELGYGIAGRREDALWVPFIAARAADGDGRSLRLGVKLTAGPNLEAGLEFGRRQGRAGTDPEHAVHLGGTLRW